MINNDEISMLKEVGDLNENNSYGHVPFGICEIFRDEFVC